MKSSLTRRSFVKATSAGLAGLGFLAAGAKSLYAAAVNKSDTLALKGGTPVRGKPFSQVWPIIDEREEQALLKALKSRNWCCLRGNAVYGFEKMFAEAMGVSHCVLSNGGTTALSASLRAMRSSRLPTRSSPRSTRLRTSMPCLSTWTSIPIRAPSTPT